MMNREAGDYRIEGAQSGQGFVHVVRDDADGGFPGKAFSGGFQHGGRKIEGYGFGVRVSLTDQVQQASIACAEVENAMRGARNEFEQGRLALAPVGDRVGAFEVFPGVVVRSPEINELGCSHEGKVYGTV